MSFASSLPTSATKMRWTCAEWTKFGQPLTVATNIQYEMDMSLFPGLDDLSISSQPSLMIHLPEVLCHCPVAVANSSQTERCATPDVDLLCYEDDKFLAYTDDEAAAPCTPTDFLELIDDIVLTEECSQLDSHAANTSTLPPAEVPGITPSYVIRDPFSLENDVPQQPFLQEQSLDPFVNGCNWPSTISYPILQHGNPEQKHSQIFSSYMDTLNRYEPPVSIQTPIQQPYNNRTVYPCEQAIMPVQNEQNQTTTIFRPFAIRPFEVSSSPFAIRPFEISPRTVLSPWTSTQQHTIPSVQTKEWKPQTSYIDCIIRPSEMKSTLLNHQHTSYHLMSRSSTESATKADERDLLFNQTDGHTFVKDRIKLHHASSTAITSSRTTVKSTSTACVSGQDVNTLKSSSSVNSDKPPAKQSSTNITTRSIAIPLAKQISDSITTPNITPPLAKQTSANTKTPNITQLAKPTSSNTTTPNITQQLAKPTSANTTTPNIAPPLAKQTPANTTTPNITQQLAKQTSANTKTPNITQQLAKLTSANTTTPNITQQLAKLTSANITTPNITQQLTKQTSANTTTPNITQQLAKPTSANTTTPNIAPPLAKQTSGSITTPNITQQLAKPTSVNTTTPNIAPPLAKQTPANTTTPNITQQLAKPTSVNTTTPNIAPPLAKQTSGSITTAADSFSTIKSTVNKKCVVTNKQCSNVDLSKPSTPNNIQPAVTVNTVKQTVVNDSGLSKKKSPRKRRGTLKSNSRKLIVAMKFVTPKTKNTKTAVISRAHIPDLPVKKRSYSESSDPVMTASATIDSTVITYPKKSAKSMTESPRSAVRQKFKPPCFCEVQALKPRSKSSNQEKVCSQKSEVKSCAKPKSTLIYRSLDTKGQTSVKSNFNSRSPRKRTSAGDSDSRPSKMRLRSCKYQKNDYCELKTSFSKGKYTDSIQDEDNFLVPLSVGLGKFQCVQDKDTLMF